MITSIGGTLGLTSAYGVSDPNITRSRIEADLAVFREYQMKYRGMIEACKQQLDWGVKRYASLPDPPKLLPLAPVPPLQAIAGRCLLFSLGWLMFVSTVFGLPGEAIGVKGMIVIYLVLFSPYIKARVANGKRPSENARRQKVYEEGVTAALKAAEPIKAAEDHRLRCQIRELEGLAKTVAEKEVDVRRILGTLRSK